MDAAGIDMQVLSHTVPGAEALPAAQAVDVVRQTNDDLAEVIAAHPHRFAGFAALPMRDPQAAATELQRTVGTLGFCGAMINGLIDGRFLDHPDFAPLLSTAADLSVPLYLHPSFSAAAGGTDLLRRTAADSGRSAGHRRLGSVESPHRTAT
ncbi:MAG TPA: amidohydrolase family protein [Mycobacterium sp.]